MAMPETVFLLLSTSGALAGLEYRSTPHRVKRQLLGNNESTAKLMRRTDSKIGTRNDWKWIN